MNTINNSINPSFKGICIKKSAMSRRQFGRAFNLAEQLPFQKCYEKFVNEGKDIFILPGKSINGLLVRVIDKYSGEYYRNSANNKIAEMTVSIEKERVGDSAAKILEFFNGAFVKKPEENMLRIFKGQTPLMKALPEVEEELADMANFAKTLRKEFAFSEKEAIKHVVEDFQMQTVPDDGFNFDF